MCQIYSFIKKIQEKAHNLFFFFFQTGYHLNGKRNGSASWYDLLSGLLSAFIPVVIIPVVHGITWLKLDFDARASQHRQVWLVCSLSNCPQLEEQSKCHLTICYLCFVCGTGCLGSGWIPLLYLFSWSPSTVCMVTLKLICTLPVFLNFP